MKPIIQYLPFGELFVSQRNYMFDSRYKFTAKELDNETSYTYFGARYYDSDLSSWLSVDPLSDKYPSLSPYIYSADNPIILIDPNGEKVYIVGDAADEATGYLSTDNIKVTRNSETGELSYTGKAKTLKEQFIVKAIERTDIEANIIAENHPIYYKGHNESAVYMGNEYIEENGNKKAIGYQYVYPRGLGKMDVNTHSLKGGYMLHEVAEAYYGCEIALERRAGSPAAREPGSTYGEAHKSANIISCGDYHVQPILGGANKPKLRYNGDFNYPFDSRNFYLDYDTIEYKKICY